MPEQPPQWRVHRLKSLQFLRLVPIWLRLFTLQMKGVKIRLFFLQTMVGLRSCISSTAG